MFLASHTGICCSDSAICLPLLGWKRTAFFLFYFSSSVNCALLEGVCRNKVRDKSKRTAERRGHISNTSIDLLLFVFQSLRSSSARLKERLQSTMECGRSNCSIPQKQTVFFFILCMWSLYCLEFYNSSHLSQLRAHEVGTFNLTVEPLALSFSERIFPVAHLAGGICESHANELETWIRLVLHLPWPSARRGSTAENTIALNYCWQLWQSKSVSRPIRKRKIQQLCVAFSCLKCFMKFDLLLIEQKKELCFRWGCHLLLLLQVKEEDKWEKCNAPGAGGLKKKKVKLEAFMDALVVQPQSQQDLHIQRREERHLLYKHFKQQNEWVKPRLLDFRQTEFDRCTYWAPNWSQINGKHTALFKHRPIRMASASPMGDWERLAQGHVKHVDSWRWDLNSQPFNLSIHDSLYQLSHSCWIRNGC